MGSKKRALVLLILRPDKNQFLNGRHIFIILTLFTVCRNLPNYTPPENACLSQNITANPLIEVDSDITKRLHR
jgi:hypothetical protein